MSSHRYAIVIVIALASASLSMWGNVILDGAKLFTNKTPNVTIASPSSSPAFHPNSFYFIHTPKTGTSLYLTLRNRLASCPVKDFTCLDYRGGGLYHTLTEDGSNLFPFTKSSLNLTIETREDLVAIENCRGTLNCKPDNLRDYHCPFLKCRHQRNKVTMIRNPYEWYPSYFRWIWTNFYSSGKNVDLRFNNSFSSQILFTAGTFDVDLAYYRLENEYLWWGITDFWNESICIFHCELGHGISHQNIYEFENWRSSAKMKNLSHLEESLPRKNHRRSYIRNLTQHVERNYEPDIRLFNEKLLPTFRRRVSACNCQ